LYKFRKKGLFLVGRCDFVGGIRGTLAPPLHPTGLYDKKGLDTGPLIIYATQCLTPVLVQLPILYKKKPKKEPKK
jgi:hypothetical protein